MANRILLCPDNCDPRIYPFGFEMTGMDAPMPYKLACQCFPIQSGFEYWPEFWDLTVKQPMTETKTLEYEKTIAHLGSNLILQVNLTGGARFWNLFAQEEVSCALYIQATDLHGSNVGTHTGAIGVVRPDTFFDAELMDWSFPGSDPMFERTAFKPMKWDDTDASIYFPGP